jgi:hypothetical protein
MINQRCLALLAVTLIGGCATPGGAPRGSIKQATGYASARVTGAGSVAEPKKPVNDGTRRVMPIVVALDVYHMMVPSGAISHNDEFWKYIDEDRIDIATHDLLMKNGVRIGLGRDADWHYFKGLLGKYPESRQVRDRTQAGKEGYLELLMRGNIPEQVLFGIDDHGDHWGRRFEKCDDLLGISYIASPHNPGEVTVKVCPIVRGLRRYFQTTVYNDDLQVEMVQPEHLYDLRLASAISMNQFLIVAPSVESRISTSMGNLFLTSDGNTGRIEHVLIIVPRSYRTDEPAPNPTKAR